jgi:hypothetical protein
LYVDLAPLLEAGLEETFLTADVAATGVTLTVKDIDGFAINQILVIGELGEETCEIVKTHASSAPSGVSITLVAGGVEFAHSANTRVRRIQYNQIEWNHSATLTGAKSVLATSDLQTDQLVQAYTDTAQTTGYYFARFKDAIGTTYSGYSDGVAYGGANADTVGYMIEVALRENSVRLSDNISREDCYRWLNAGIRFVEGKQLHMPKGLVANYNAGQALRGTNVLTLPTDIYDTTTNQSIKAARIGSETLSWLDPEAFAEQMAQTSVTQVRTQAVATDITLPIDNSYDFDDSGTVSVYISGTKYDITYTGVTRSATAGVLTGVPASGDGSITVTIPVDTYVWQGETEGTPTYFTVRNGNLEYWPLADSSHDNLNIEMDYFTYATIVNSDGDVIDVNRYEMLLDYLTWRVRMKDKNSGKLDMTDGYYLMFKEKLNDAIRTSRSPFVHKMAPKLNRINYHKT